MFSPAPPVNLSSPDEPVNASSPAPALNVTPLWFTGTYAEASSDSFNHPPVTVALSAARAY